MPFLNNVIGATIRLSAISSPYLKNPSLADNLLGNLGLKVWKPVYIHWFSKLEVG